MDWKNSFWALSLAGTIVTFIGTLLTLFVKDFFLINLFEKRRDRKTLDGIFKKYKDPITLSAIELSSRLAEILEHHPVNYLERKVLKFNSTSFLTNTIEDNHYRKHKFFSTIYRHCTFLGWLELYRQEITFLSCSNDAINVKLESSLSKIRSAMADGQLNENEDWEEWQDCLIFREEQRGIGENMILSSQNPKAIIGYSKFKSLMEDYIQGNGDDWIGLSLNFFVELKEEKDFRRDRYYLLIHYLKDLLVILGVNTDNEQIRKLDKVLGMQ